MGHKVKIAIVLLLLIGLVGCATSNVAMRLSDETEINKYIKSYVRKHGYPVVEMEAINYEMNVRYVEFYWDVNGEWFKITLVGDEDGWQETYNSFKLRSL